MTKIYRKEGAKLSEFSLFKLVIVMADLCSFNRDIPDNSHEAIQMPEEPMGWIENYDVSFMVNMPFTTWNHGT